MAQRFAGPMTGRPLPTGGSPGEQPAALMDAFEILERLLAEPKSE